MEPTVNHPIRTRQAARGLTLVELLCSLFITVILLGSALPSLHDWQQRQRLQAAAATLETDVHYARSVSLSANRGVVLAVQAMKTGGSCTIVHTGPANACECDGSGQAICTGEATALRVTEQPASTGVVFTTVGKSLRFDPGKGTVTPTATLKLADDQGRSITKIINIMGRVRSCSGSAMPGFSPCA